MHMIFSSQVVQLLIGFMHVLVHITSACLNIKLYSGVLSSSLELKNISLSPRANSCTCCGQCYQHSACKSLSFNEETHECILYRTVGSHGDLKRTKGDTTTQFFFMPGRSLTNEFCRRDSDCVTSGDFCRGRICTTDTTVTCRDLYLLNSSLPNGGHWVFIARMNMIVKCAKKRGTGGYTLLLKSVAWEGWNVNNRLRYATFDESGEPRLNRKYSIMWLADAIRDSSDSRTYSVVVTATQFDKQGSSDKDDWSTSFQQMHFTVPKDLSILNSHPTPIEYTMKSGSRITESNVSLPYMTNNGINLFHINMDAASEYGALIRRGSSLKWSPSFGDVDMIQLYIRE